MTTSGYNLVMDRVRIADLKARLSEYLRQVRRGESIVVVQEELAKMECEGAAGGGLVTATVNGAFEVVRVKIDKSVVDPNDVGMLEDLVLAAVNSALRAAQQLAQAQGGPLSSIKDLFPGMVP